jgi:hypothetical protein
LQRQTATAGILQVIANSPSDVQPVFDAVAERAMSLLDCWSVIVTRFDGEHVHFGPHAVPCPIPSSSPGSATNRCGPTRPTCSVAA